MVTLNTSSAVSLRLILTTHKLRSGSSILSSTSELVWLFSCKCSKSCRSNNRLYSACMFIQTNTTHACSYRQIRWLTWIWCIIKGCSDLINFWCGQELLHVITLSNYPYSTYCTKKKNSQQTQPQTGIGLLIHEMYDS